MALPPGYVQIMFKSEARDLLRAFTLRLSGETGIRVTNSDALTVAVRVATEHMSESIDRVKDTK